MEVKKIRPRGKESLAQIAARILLGQAEMPLYKDITRVIPLILGSFCIIIAIVMIYQGITVYGSIDIKALFLEGKVSSGSAGILFAFVGLVLILAGALGEQHMNDKTEDFDSMKNLETIKEDDVRAIYEQYSQWARNFHGLVWISSSFGIGIALGGLAFFEKSTFVEYFVIGIGCLLLLLFSYAYAEGTRTQLMGFWKILNTIEKHWGIRKQSNDSGPLLGSPIKRSGRSQRIRKGLVLACVLFWLIALVTKSLGNENERITTSNNKFQPTSFLVG